MSIRTEPRVMFSGLDSRAGFARLGSFVSGPFYFREDVPLGTGVKVLEIEHLHTPECAAAFDRFKEQLREYHDSYPNHCRHCRGWGGFEYYFTHPYPEPPDEGFDPCTECVEQGRCPRCGGSIKPAWDNEGEFTCTSCGYDSSETSGEPQWYECWCSREEDDERRA